MMIKKIPHSLLTLAILFLFYSPQALTIAENQEPYETVKKFCSNQKRFEADTNFCLRVLKSDPRSASAKDNQALLLISNDLSIIRLNKTRDYLGSSFKKEGPKSDIKECLDAYNWGIGELQIIPGELKDDPSTVSYDALMAMDAMTSCENSLEKHQISDPYVLSRHKIDRDYIQLVVDVSMTVD